jgi:hypothetical protein
VKAVLDWLLPHSVRAVRAFLGLAGYYRWFVKDYGNIAAPLTRLLCKDAFKWGPKAEVAFWALQHALTTAPRCSCQTLTVTLSSSATPPAPTWGSCYTKARGQSRSSAARSCPITPRWRLMNEN